MVMLTKKALILAKIEAEYGTDPTPAPATDSILVSSPDIKPVLEKNERPAIRPVLSKIPHIMGSRHQEISFSTEVKGSGAAGTVPEISPLLRACGMDETINAGTSVEYLPVSIGFESCTIYAYLDGIIHKASGCRGSFEIVMEAGKIAQINWTFQGLFQTPVDGAIPSGAAYNATKPPAFLSGTFTYGGYAAIIQKLQLALNNEIMKSPSIAEATGYKGIEITDRKPAGSMNPEAVIEATHTFWANLASGQESALQAVIGATAGNILTIDCPKCVKDEIAWGERESMRIYDIPISLYGNTGDDEFKLTFT